VTVIKGLCAKMDILKIATDWAKIELISNSVFVLASVIFLSVSLFLQIGARESHFSTYSLPFVIAAILLLILGAGLLFSTWQHSTNLEFQFQQDMTLFIQAELTRAEKTISQYKLAVNVIFPALGLISFCILLVFQNDQVRASAITSVIVLLILITVDTAAKERLVKYTKDLAMPDHYRE
jgi:ABC-2 type transport system permease protein